MPPTTVLALPAAAQGEALEAPAGTFEALLGEHQAMVYSLALHTLRDRGLAEDVDQEAFLRLSQRLGDLRSGSHALFWLRQVTCHLCIDELRRRRPGSLEDHAEPGVEPALGDPFLEARLRRLVGDLPPKARLAVVLRYQEDLDPAEIAELLKEPVPTVKSRLQRALATLRTALEKEAPHERPRHAPAGGPGPRGTARGLTGKVLARTRRAPKPALRPLLAAAALLLVLGGTWAVKVQEHRRAREARAEAQLELALRIASHRLNEAFNRANALKEQP